MNQTGLSHGRLLELREVYRDGLLENVLPFWLQHAVDTKHGGITTSVNRSGQVIDTDKSLWQQGRFAWLLGELYNNVEHNSHWLTVAQSTLEFIEQYGFDSADGRMWFQVTCDGKPLRKRRYAFSESFAAIAFGEMALATGEQRYADRAVDCFNAFIQQNLNPRDAQPKYTDTRPTQGLGFPMITLITAQELRDSIQFEQATEWIDRSIDTIRTQFLKPHLQCVMETVGPAGEIIDHFDGRMLNPGHAIEGAWFIMYEGKIRGDAGLIQTGCQMLDWMWERGWDQTHGGLLYFVDLHGHPVQEYWHDMKFWWPQNELIIASLLAWQLTGDEKYARQHTLAHDWAHQNFPDTESDQGEWFGYLHRDGRRSSELKGNMWKGPFHLPRMQLVCWQLVEEMLSSGKASAT